MNARDRSRTARGISLALGAIGALLSVATSATAQQPQTYSGEGAQACLECHESDSVMGIRETPHADFEDPRSPAAREQCESCHGPSATHMEFPMQVGNIVFTKHAKTPIAERNDACLVCHEDGAQAHWKDGAHGQELACASCHVMHKPSDPTLVTSRQAQRCGECHKDILETAPAAAPHPLVGAKAIYCTQCHNPHGPTSLTSCNECHEQDATTLARQRPKAQEYHQRAIARKIDCTACHKGFVHAMPPLAEVHATP
jgi:predicted CXXCH cytochrome family protein